MRVFARGYRAKNRGQVSASSVQLCRESESDCRTFATLNFLIHLLPSEPS